MPAIKKPRLALVLGGGGARGAFQVGVINWIRNQRKITNFPVVSGTSTGALVGSLVCLKRWARLEKIYTTVKTEQIINPNNPLLFHLAGEVGGLIGAALTGGSSVFSTAALQEMIKDNVDFARIKKRSKDCLLVYSTVNLRSGAIQTFDNRRHGKGALFLGLLASASEPVFMDPVKITKQGVTDLYVDGGIRELIPVVPVFESKEELDGIIVVSTRPIEAKVAAKNPESLVEVLGRTMDLFLTEVGHNDFHGAVRVNALLQVVQNALATGQISERQLFRGVSKKLKDWILERRAVPMVFVGPKKHLGISSLDFQSDKMTIMAKLGQTRAGKLLPRFLDSLAPGIA